MIKNIGKSDKIIRISVGVLFILLNIFSVVGGWFGGILLVLAVVSIGTSFINFCPAYLPLGINTCKKKG